MISDQQMNHLLSNEMERSHYAQGKLIQEKHYLKEQNKIATMFMEYVAREYTPESHIDWAKKAKQTLERVERCNE